MRDRNSNNTRLSKIYIDVYLVRGVKRGDGDEEGIYLLAKDLAYYVALDQTDKLTEGIKQLTKKNMHEVSKAINILDSSKTIDGKICKGKWKDSSAAEADGYCWSGVNQASINSTYTNGLSDMFGHTDTAKRKYPADADTKMSTYDKTSAKISTDIVALDKDQKGVVSSAFAKAHEGAEIVEIRSISTTSVMVNACYDVLAEGLPVFPYGCAGIMIVYRC